MKKSIVMAVAAILVTLVSGCGLSFTTPLDIPDTVSISRNKTHQPIPPFTDKTVHDFSLVQRLYNDIRALPPASDGPISCPADFGISYHLTFLRDKKIVLEADIDTAGCQMVKLSDSNRARWTMKPEGRVFWSDLGKTFGLTDKELHPMPYPVQNQQ